MDGPSSSATTSAHASKPGEVATTQADCGLHAAWTATDRNTQVAVAMSTSYGFGVISEPNTLSSNAMMLV